jgi:hypothetical protein
MLSDYDVDRIAEALANKLSSRKRVIREPERYVNADELAKELRIAKQTIYNNPGRFFVTKVGRRNVYPLNRIRREFHMA